MVGGFLGLGVAQVGELADVLERVGAEGAAEVLDTADHHAEAVEVLWDLGSVSDILEVCGEEAIDELTVVEFGLKLGVGLGSALVDDLLVLEVQIVVTRVDGLACFFLLAQGLLVIVFGL